MLQETRSGERSPAHLHDQYDDGWHQHRRVPNQIANLLACAAAREGSSLFRTSGRGANKALRDGIFLELVEALPADDTALHT